MAIPYWVTPGNLGVYTNNYNFNASPIVINFNASNTSSLSLLNGSIPDGLQATINQSNITLTGESNTLDAEIGTFTYRISDNSTVADRTFSIYIQEGYQLPSWANQSTILGIASSGQNVEIQTAATAFGLITYGLVGSIPVGNITNFNSSTGKFYYHSPNVVVQNSLVPITLSATDAIGTSFLNANIQLLSTVSPYISTNFHWNGTTEFGTVIDGDNYIFDVTATSTRTNAISYSILGGVLPPFMILDKSQGKIYGFLEYHTQFKEYYFEIAANDGVEELVNEFHLSVKPSTLDQITTIKIPLTGKLKDYWLRDLNGIFDSRIELPDGNFLPRKVTTPELTLISGLISNVDDPEQFFDYASNLDKITMHIGPVSNAIASSTTTEIYRQIIDPQQASSFNVVITGNNFDIPSLNNWREDFQSLLSYVNGGLGTGGVLNAIIDAGTGAISSIDVISSGSNYLYMPKITLNDMPTEFTGTLKLVEVTILNSNSMWSPGDQIELNVGRYNSPAILQAISVDLNGTVTQFKIIDAGIYTQYPNIPTTMLSSNGKDVELIVSFGIRNVNVVNSPSGLHSAILTVNGTEKLPNWQSTWSAVLPMALINNISIDQVNSEIEEYTSNTHINTNGLDGELWSVNSMIVEIEGKRWQGDCIFDCSFDSDESRFEDCLEPQDIFVNQNFDDTFIENQPDDFQKKIYNIWGTTIFDDPTPEYPTIGGTILDDDETILDMETPSFRSSTLIRKLYTFEADDDD